MPSFPWFHTPSYCAVVLFLRKGLPHFMHGAAERANLALLVHHAKCCGKLWLEKFAETRDPWFIWLAWVASDIITSGNSSLIVNRSTFTILNSVTDLYVLISVLVVSVTGGEKPVKPRFIWRSNTVL